MIEKINSKSITTDQIYTHINCDFETKQEQILNNLTSNNINLTTKK